MIAPTRKYRLILPIAFVVGPMLLGFAALWRAHHPTLQVPLAPQTIRHALGRGDYWRLSYQDLQLYETWRWSLSSAPSPSFSADGKLVLIGVGLQARLYDTKTGNQVGQWEIPQPKPGPRLLHQRFSLSLCSVSGEYAWYVRCATTPQKDIRVYRLTPGQKQVEPIPQLTSVARVFHEGKLVFGYGENGERLCWNRDTGKVTSFSGDFFFDWQSTRMDSVTGVLYTVAYSRKKGNEKRVVFLDPVSGKERPVPDYLRRSDLVAVRFREKEVALTYTDGKIEIRSRQSPERVQETYSTKLQQPEWSAFQGDRMLWVGGSVACKDPKKGYRIGVERIDRSGAGGGRVFSEADILGAPRDEVQVSEIVENWGTTRLCLLSRSWVQNRTSIRHETVVCDTTTGNEVRIPGDVRAMQLSLSPKEDCVAWIDQTGVLNFWQVPL